jgi:hypothetical protein
MQKIKCCLPPNAVAFRVTVSDPVNKYRRKP